MKIIGNESELTILKELGKRIKNHRISMNITQIDLAEQCGISVSTEMRIENGDDSKFSNYIKVMSVLGLTENFDLLIPDEKPDYKALFEERVTRKRASRINRKPENAWIWGEDEGE